MRKKNQLKLWAAAEERWLLAAYVRSQCIVVTLRELSVVDTLFPLAISFKPLCDLSWFLEKVNLLFLPAYLLQYIKVFHLNSLQYYFSLFFLSLSLVFAQMFFLCNYLISIWICLRYFVIHQNCTNTHVCKLDMMLHLSRPFGVRVCVLCENDGTILLLFFQNKEKLRRKEEREYYFRQHHLEINIDH